MSDVERAVQWCAVVDESVATYGTLQGRLEEADQLLRPLGTRVEMRADVALAVAALLLARGDASAATRHLEQRTDQINEGHAHLTAALDLLVDAHLAAATRRRPLSGHVWRSPTQVARRRFELARVLADRSPEISIEHAGHALRAFEELGAASTPIGSLRSYGHRASGRGPAPTASGP